MKSVAGGVGIKAVAVVEGRVPDKVHILGELVVRPEGIGILGTGCGIAVHTGNRAARITGKESGGNGKPARDHAHFYKGPEGVSVIRGACVEYVGSPGSVALVGLAVAEVYADREAADHALCLRVYCPCVSFFIQIRCVGVFGCAAPPLDSGAQVPTSV